ncbi:hypothetical protein ACLPHM_05670 [Paenalcaligenes sp. Me131]|uniref:hypothetical protein n=1 Tax=Paenalcaligenes sp. Me131 TaxID=3392636 RepID=UPI003D2C384D
MTHIYIQYCDISTEAGSDCPVQHRQKIAIEREILEASGNPIPTLNSAELAQVFSLGFSVVLLFFLLGRGVGTVLNLIRRG